MLSCQLRSLRTSALSVSSGSWSRMRGPGWPRAPSVMTRKRNHRPQRLLGPTAVGDERLSTGNLNISPHRYHIDKRLLHFPHAMQWHPTKQYNVVMCLEKYRDSACGKLTCYRINCTACKANVSDGINPRILIASVDNWQAHKGQYGGSLRQSGPR